MTNELSDLAADLFLTPQERDPMRSARQGMPALPKRFYAQAEAAPLEGGFTVLLDGKQVKTPAKRALIAPTATLGEALAAEWAGQGERIDPATMPLTRLINSAIDGVAQQMVEVEADVLKYAASDLICYRAGSPQSLAEAQEAGWGPLLGFAHDRLGAELLLAEGVTYVEQPEAAIAALARGVRTHVGEGVAAPFRLAALHTITTLTGSLVIALATVLGATDAETAWTAAHIDEDFQIAAWGADGEAMARREARARDMQAAALLSAGVTV
jgi:chaperone required for assembly of F1-ATPase